MIWCVEDDAGIRDIEVYALTSTGLEARGFSDAMSAWEALQEERPDLIVLDVMLPGMDGIEFLQAVRNSERFCEIPVIMATARGTEYDKVRSLDLGADDYLAKPFGMMEMVSRVKAVLRRCKPKGVQVVLKAGGLELNLESHTVLIDGQRVALTYKEFALLHLLMANPNRAFTREKLYEAVWESDFIGETRTVDMHIRTLRQKLGAYGSLIETVRNVGYRLGDLDDK